MKLAYSERFLKSYRDAPSQVQRAFNKQSQLLIQNLRHPSLHAKKYDEANDIWQARVNRDWRFYFTIEGDTYYLHTIIPHPK
jgi:mRNA-degrading endonuclease RelE of RelBE toxin-antitoxin system